MLKTIPTCLITPVFFALSGEKLMLHYDQKWLIMICRKQHLLLTLELLKPKREQNLIKPFQRETVEFGIDLLVNKAKVLKQQVLSGNRRNTLLFSFFTFEIEAFPISKVPCHLEICSMLFRVLCMNGYDDTRRHLSYKSLQIVDSGMPS